MRSSRRGRRRSPDILVAWGISAAGASELGFSAGARVAPAAAAAAVVVSAVTVAGRLERLGGDRLGRRVAVAAELMVVALAAALAAMAGRCVFVICETRSASRCSLPRWGRRACPDVGTEPAPMRRISSMKCAACRASRSCAAASSARSLVMVAACWSACAWAEPSLRLQRDLAVAQTADGLAVELLEGRQRRLQPGDLAGLVLGARLQAADLALHAGPDAPRPRCRRPSAQR